MMRSATAIALILSLLMSVLSAYIRLDDSGIDCEPWPACYGVAVVIDDQPGVTISAEDSNRGLRVVHRLMASAFGILILGVATAAAWYRRVLGISLVWPITAVVITVVLSLVGMNTPDIHRPIVTTTNLVGGMLLAVVLLHMYLELGTPSLRFPFDAKITAASLMLMILLVVTGAWVSANFAAGSCEDNFFSCDLGPESRIADAFDPGRELQIEAGSIVTSPANEFILLVHQSTGPIAAFVVIFVGVVAVSARGFSMWMAAPSVCLAGILVVTFVELVDKSVAAASAHNLLSLLLLLSLVYHLHRQRQPDP